MDTHTSGVGVTLKIVNDKESRSEGTLADGRGFEKEAPGSGNELDSRGERDDLESSWSDLAERGG